MGEQRDRRLEAGRVRDQRVGFGRAFDEDDVGTQPLQLPPHGPRRPGAVMPHAKDGHPRVPASGFRATKPGARQHPAIGRHPAVVRRSRYHPIAIRLSVKGRHTLRRATQCLRSRT
ncbi:hypothetical protein GCM10027203_34360 [Nonomuraea fastidiosa]